MASKGMFRKPYEWRGSQMRMRSDEEEGLPGKEQRQLNPRNDRRSWSDLRGQSKRMRENIETYLQRVNEEEERRQREFDDDEPRFTNAEDVTWGLFTGERPYFTDERRGRINKEGKGGLFRSKRMLSNKTLETS